MHQHRWLSSNGDGFHHRKAPVPPTNPSPFPLKRGEITRTVCLVGVQLVLDPLAQAGLVDLLLKGILVIARLGLRVGLSVDALLLEKP